MIDKPIEEIEKSDVDALVNDAVPEGRRIDYKRALWDFTKDKEKVEFLTDVASFANASGGDIGEQGRRALSVSLSTKRHAAVSPNRASSYHQDQTRRCHHARRAHSGGFDSAPKKDSNALPRAIGRLSAYFSAPSVSAGAYPGTCDRPTARIRRLAARPPTTRKYM